MVQKFPPAVGFEAAGWNAQNLSRKRVKKMLCLAHRERNYQTLIMSAIPCWVTNARVTQVIKRLVWAFNPHRRGTEDGWLTNGR